MKRILDVILRAIAACSLIIIPVAFILSGSTLTRGLDSLLHVKVDPRFSGGTVRARFYDPAGDDHGEGGLTYPKAGRAATGALDIVRYTVYAPVADDAWSGESAYWQLGVTLLGFDNSQAAPNGFTLPSIRIYVDTDGAASGSVETAAARAELVSFDPAAPWDVSVSIDGWHDQALLRTADGRLRRRVPLIVVAEQKSVYVRLPLDVPEVKRILDGRATRHYVLACCYDQYAVDGVMQVKETASQDEGGGARSRVTPRVFDALAVGSGQQEAMLSSYDEAGMRYAVLRPVTVEAGILTGATGPAGDARAGADLDALQARADAEARAERDAAAARLAEQAASEDPLTAGAALFQLGKREEAKARFTAVLAADPAHPVALAYLGSLAAMEGGASGSVADAVRLVNEAFELLDKAASAAKTDDEREIVLMNRASVASAVPEDVFGKSVTAARDYTALAEMADARGDSRAASDLFVSAAAAFEKAGSASEADVAFARALSEKEHTARALLELAKRGYPVPIE